MRVVIHRGAKEVGGSCVEISNANSTILIDLGLPLDFDVRQDVKSVLPPSLSSLLCEKHDSIDGVLLSHPHLDHYGLVESVPSGTAIYCGEA